MIPLGMGKDVVFIVTPKALYFNGIPGQSIENSILVENTGEKAITLEVKPLGIKQIDSYGHLRNTSTGTKSLQSWITANKQRIDLEPGTKTVVSFTVAIPKHVPQGTYTGTLAFMNSGSLLKIEKGVVLAVDVGESVHTSLSVSDFYQNIQITAPFSNTIRVGLRNTTDTVAQPGGNISVYSLSNKQLIHLPVTGVIVLPEQTFSLSYSIPLSVPGIYKTKLDITYQHGVKHIVREGYIVSPVLLYSLIILLVALVLKFSHYHWKKIQRKRKKK